MWKKRKELEESLAALELSYSRLLAEHTELQEEHLFLRQEWEKSKSNREEVQRLNDSTRRLKHDMKNHLMVLGSFLGREEYERARDYLSELLDLLGRSYSYLDTGNELMNHILNTKLELACRNGISVKAEVENLAFEGIGSIDFSALMGNLLDNAIEACQREEEQVLEVYVLRQRAYETILIKNKIHHPVLEENPRLLSSKGISDKHGLGIPQVRRIAEKYGGMLDFYEEDGMFCAYFMYCAQA